ncbi:hypothetical protein BJV82DRAFT_586520 [Fennellomyces sp. T-0311]|nr:hypothetical protein BJV82DRAFT_586520 [Fennellomyces sp. T-0311]
MEVSRRTIERSNTLGPMAAIQEWELERAMALSQLQQYRERVHWLETKAEQDKKLYDKHRMSLLREVRLKEMIAEKRVQDIEERYLEQIQDLQIQLDEEKRERQDEVQELRQHYDKMLQSEQTKHERRICGFQQRLSAKETEYARLQKNLRQTQSAPTSPTTPDTPIHSDCDSVATEEDMRDTPLRLMQEKLFKLQASHDKAQIAWEQKWTKQQQAFQEERSSYTARIKDLEDKLLGQQDPLQLERLQKEYQKGAQRVYEERLRNIEQAYAAKSKLTMESYRGDLQQMQDRFMHETREMAMHFEAQRENQASEHKQLLTEIKEHHDNELEVFRIEHQAAIDELETQLEHEKQDALNKCEQEWKDKLSDIEASMSDDARQTQKHWESRVASAAVTRQAEFTRLTGELEVLKDRLGREIERRRDIEMQLAKSTEQLEHSRKAKAIATRECLDLQREQRRAHALATKLASISSEPLSLGDPTLCELLQRSISQVTRLQAENSILEKVRFYITSHVTVSPNMHTLGV